jgi:purine-binding chemotaxis protein CheW
MADARKRARRGAEPRAKEPEPSREPEAASERVFADETVFADDPATQGEAAGAGGASLSLPASGLAEDILKEYERAQSAEAGGEDAGAAGGGPLTLPASGLAEDVLGRAEEVLGRAEEVIGREHTLSFFSAPAQAQRAAVEATEHLATFYLAREEYGVDVKQVQEIRRVTEITGVPRAPEFVRGVINLRGRILPVLDLKRRLALGEVVVGRAARIVVVRVKDRLLGLLVDGASQVLKIPVSQVEPAPEEVLQKGGDYIRGVAKLDDRLIILVDLERLLEHELTAEARTTGLARAAEAADGASQE